MPYYDAGKILKLARRARKITQGELCRDICAVETLSRMETGKRSINYSVFRQLAERLGCFYPNETDPHWNLLCEKCDTAIRNYNHSEAEKRLSQLKHISSDIPAHIQFIMIMEAINHFGQNRITASEKCDIIDRAIRITAPDYDQLEDIFPWSYEECRYLMNLANAYGDYDSKSEKAVSLYHTILRCIDSKYMFGKDVDDLRLRVTFDLCYTISDAGQRTDAVAIANDLLESSVLADSGWGVSCAISESLWVLHKTGSDPEKLRYSVRMLIYLAIATNCPLLENNLRRQFADLL
ncbi:MAG: helix-turn-helix domain-containing protein [Lachnospiraceae bacterium]|nr:helix-turn-helix domain-containing protein [Lachnospiraceae bacterium]